jgi:hypothetical protein
MIKVVGNIIVGAEVMGIAQSIREQNYKVNTPSKYHKHTGNNHPVIYQLSGMFDCDFNKVDYVYFSSKEGAEPHTDQLSLSKYEEDTILIPLILPRGISTLEVGEWAVTLEPLLAYRFKHTDIHSLKLQDTESGCVMIMAAVLK